MDCYHVVSGKPIGDREVQQGEVFYFAGENPDDVRARWLVLSREMGIDPNTDKITWIVGAKDLGAIAQQIGAEVAAKGIKPAYVVVDTAAAYFPGDEENGNVQMGICPPASQPDQSAGRPMRRGVVPSDKERDSREHGAARRRGVPVRG